MPPVTVPDFTLKPLTAADLLPDLVQKISFNFDQIFLNGGGPKGDKGDKGDKGLPGATGVGLQGDQGIRGSHIFFTSQSVISGTYVSDPDQIENDILIDVNGNYFEVIPNPSNSNLQYIFQFNLNTASVNTYVINQDDYQNSSSDPINLRLLRDGGTGGNEMNLLMVRRMPNSSGFTKSEYYRLGLGVDTYITRNATVLIANILPNSTDPSSSNAFAQVAFVHRATPASSIGANATYVKYDEDVANSQYVFSVENSSVAVYLKHDTSNSLLSEYIIKGSNTVWAGASVNPLIPSEYAILNIQANLATFTAQTDYTINSNGLIGIFTVDFFATQINSRETTFSASNFVAFDTETIIIGKVAPLNPVSMELRNDVYVTTGSACTWNFDVEVDVNNKLAIGQANVAINASNQLDITNSTASIFLVPGNASRKIASFVGAKTRQWFTIIATSSPVEIEATSAIKLASVPVGKTLILEADEAITFVKDAGGTFRQADGLKHHGFGRGFKAADYSNDFNNLVYSGTWLITGGGAMSNASPISTTSNNYITEVFVRGSNILQRQYDTGFYSTLIVSGSPPLACDTWERQYSSGMNGGWSDWCQVAYTNKVNDWYMQRFSESTALIQSNMTGTMWTPAFDGNHFIFTGSSPITIEEIYDIGTPNSHIGTEITLTNLGSVDVTLGLSVTPVSGGFAIYSSGAAELGLTTIDVQPGESIRFKLTTFLSTEVFMITALPDKLMRLIDSIIDLESWHTVGGGGEPAFAATWAHTFGSGSGQQPAQFRINGSGEVSLRGSVTATTMAGTTIYTLPTGYRPSETVGFACPKLDGSSDVVPVYVTSAGAVIVGDAALVGTTVRINLAPIKFYND